MDKFIIHIDNTNKNFNDKLYKLIEGKCKNIYNELDILKKWNMIVKEWFLIKYINLDKCENECECYDYNKLYISNDINSNYILMINYHIIIYN